jgi:hypothetical protein
MVAELGAAPTSAAALVAAGLWHAPGHACHDCPQPAPEAYVFHQWSPIQPSRVQVQERRRVRAEAGAKGGAVSGRVRRLRAIGEDET